MRNVFKMFLAPMLLLSTIGAVAQTVATNENVRSAQENGQQTAATVAAARLNEILLRSHSVAATTCCYDSKSKLMIQI